LSAGQKTLQAVSGSAVANSMDFANGEDAPALQVASPEFEHFPENLRDSPGAADWKWPTATLGTNKRGVAFLAPFARSGGI